MRKVCSSSSSFFFCELIFEVEIDKYFSDLGWTKRFQIETQPNQNENGGFEMKWNQNDLNWFEMKSK